jgi:hypothetical protein
MKKYYNVRNSKGQWTKQVRRAKNGQYSTKQNRIVAGRLYGFKDLIVRAGHVENGLRFISAHNILFGFTPEADLYKIDKSKVNSYLSNAR